MKIVTILCKTCHIYMIPYTLLTMVDEIYRRLDEHYPQEIGFIESRSPFEHLVAVILSAQTTDRQVNQVTSTLFSAYPGPAELSSAHLEDVERIIHPVGFFHVKGKYIIAAAQAIYHKFNGNVPEDMESLLSLPGVGRKSANVIRGACFGMPAVIVDTHFSRVIRRLSLVKSSNPDTIEREIREIVAENNQYRFSMAVNMHGRRVCHAKRPDCDSCILQDICPKNGLF